jgi:hypothetical protein
VNEVLQGIVGHPVTLALWPVGTANVLAHALGIPRRVPDLVRMIAEHHSRPLSLGRANDRYFAAMVGIGLDASIVRHVNPRLKRNAGVLAYWIAGLQHLFIWEGSGVHARARELARPRDVRRARQCAELRWGDPHGSRCTSRFGGVARMHHHEPQQVGVSAPLPAPWRFWGGISISPASFTWVRSEDARMPIRGWRSPFRWDGEWAGTLPVDFEIIPRALRVVVPRASRR